jgi:hypothetical protein
MVQKRSPQSKNVEDQIHDSVVHYHWWWRWWNTIAMTMALFAIISSFYASIIAATKGIESPNIAAIIAGLPALILTIDRLLKCRERADWFWNFVLRYQELARALERNDINSKEASRWIDDIERMANLTDPAQATPSHAEGGPRLSCPSCSAPNECVNKYCGQCGKPLRAPTGQ